MIPSLTKSIRSGAPIEAFYPGFREDPKFCPMLALKIYEKKNHLGKVLNHGTYYLPPLGIEAIKSVKPATIGHWLKNLIKEAGIDTSLYTACSILHTLYCILHSKSSHLLGEGSRSAYDRDTESSKLELCLNILPLL